MANVENITGTAMDPHNPLSGGAVPASNYGWQQAYPYPKTGESYDGWYGNSGQTTPHVPANNDHSPQNVYYTSR